ncbi:MAG TPA: MqnA/MqnD/SBP family protein [Rhodothermales bacterium]
MRVAIWDHLPKELFAGPGRGVKGPVEFLPVPQTQASVLLDEGEFDAALLPTLTILQQPDAYDVFPAVGFSSWDYPFAQLLLEGPLGSEVHVLGYESGHEMEAVVSRAVLREHYGSEVETQTADANISGEHVDASVRVGPHRKPTAGGFAMDLGREWFELANYPMVWGLFATGKGNGTQGTIRMLRDAVIRLDDLRQMRARSVEDDVVRDFLENQVRLRVDDLAVASLTELSSYVYYYGAVPEIRNVPFISIEDEDEDTADDGSDDLLP